MSSSYIFEYNRKMPKGPSRLDIFEFDVPIRPPTSDTQSFEVEMLKYYFGLIRTPGETATANRFNTRLQVRISQWQSDNFQEILEEGRKRDALVGREVTINQRADLFDEQGEIGDLTFRVMMQKGFDQAVKEFLESEYFNQYINTLEKEDLFGEGYHVSKDSKPLVDEYGNTSTFPMENDEIQKPPKVGKNYITYKYVTKYTVKDFPSKADFYKEDNAGTLMAILIESVLKVFQFYNQS